MKIRRKTAVPRNAGAVLPMLACLAAQAAEGGFLEEAKTDLVLRNYYFCGEVTVLTHAKRGMDRLEPL